MKKILITVLLALAAGATFIAVNTYKKSDTYKVQKEIADNIIRFHVRANSDSTVDQELKLKVKDRVVQYLEEELGTAQSLDEARNILYDDMGNLEQIALDVIQSEGFAYDVNVYFETSYFPMKVYGDMSFPPGEYEALRIDIGEACGRNWWCVLFPPLCFVDSACSVVPEDTKEQFRSVLSEEAYDTLTIEDLREEKYQFRFKYLTFLNGFLD
ncbi:MAG: stage II sporulation protein R [Butyrivibrio sp.]